MRNLTLVEWILLGVIALTGMALALPARARARRHADVVECRENLRAMFKAAQEAPPAPEALGSAYWRRLKLPPKTLRCPMVPEGIARDCDYLGPSSDPAGLGPDVPIGCDIPENHQTERPMGGNVLYKSGEVKTLHPVEGGGWVDPWREASREKCRP